MAAKRKKKYAKVNWITVLALSIVASASILITLASSMNLPLIPSWDELYVMLGLKDAPISMDGTCSVHIIDVGQGDSILIQDENKTILIDAGESDRGEDVVLYLKQKGIKRLDYIIGTHPHSDHIGGLNAVLDSFDVGIIIFPNLPDDLVPTTRTYTDLLTAIAKKGLKLKAAKAGETIALGGGTFTILGPVGDFTSLNNMSVVLKFIYGNTSFLLTGDAEKQSEEAMIRRDYDLSADVLKIGHHGSETSTSKGFLAAVNPRFTAISVGTGNMYGLPKEDTLTRIDDMGAKIYRTDLDGTIVFKSDGNTILISTQKGK